jgi:predicted hydrocarbon binding protein
MNEIVGPEDTHRILQHGAVEKLSSLQDQPSPDVRIPYRQISHIQQTLESLFGDRGGKGVAYRMGQSTFRYGLRELSWALELTGPAYRLLAPFQKITAGAQFLAASLNENSDQDILLEAGKTSLRWIVQRCPVCWGRHSDTSVCHFTAGFLNEFVTWSSGGKSFSINEDECMAAGGSACIFSVARLAGD